jgi:hypothetical protein
MSGENDETFEDIDEETADTVLKDVLQKAKAKNDDKESDEDEMDEAYMKRYMKKFMKKNPDYMKGKTMKKAEDLDNLYTDVESETSNAQMISLDGTEFFKAFVEMGQELIKAYDELSEKIDSMHERLEYNEELQKASSEVLLESHEAVKNFGSTPQERKSQAAVPVPVQGSQENLVPDEQTVMLLQKAMTMPFEQISNSLLKAAMKDGKVVNQEAARVLGRFEAGGGLIRLGKADLQYVIDNVVSPKVITNEGGAQ